MAKEGDTAHITDTYRNMERLWKAWAGNSPASRGLIKLAETVNAAESGAAALVESMGRSREQLTPFLERTEQLRKMLESGSKASKAMEELSRLVKVSSSISALTKSIQARAPRLFELPFNDQVGVMRQVTLPAELFVTTFWTLLNDVPAASLSRS